jgi:hypothetical protein
MGGGGGEGEAEYRVLGGNFGESLEDLGIDGMIILKCISQKLRGIWTELIWLRIERSGVLL